MGIDSVDALYKISDSYISKTMVNRKAMTIYEMYARNGVERFVCCMEFSFCFSFLLLFNLDTHAITISCIFIITI